MLVAVAGRSGIGKSRLVNELCDRYSALFERPVAVTTRPRRSFEATPYRFIGEPEFESLSASGSLLHEDRAYGHQYAIERTSIQRIVSAGRTPVHEIHPGNFDALRQHIDLLTVLVDRTLVNPPTDREIPDQSFADTFPTAGFDTTVNFDNSSEYSPELEALALKVLAHLSHRSRFPEPALIDRTNRSGYSVVGAEFRDDLRPTTNQFHQLSARSWCSAIDRLPPGSQIVELGPGSGWLWQIAPSLSSHDYLAIDVAQMEGGTRTRVIDTFRHMPMKTSSADVIVASLCEGAFYPLVVTEVHRVLKPGGLLITSLPARMWSQGLRKEDPDRTIFSLSDGRRVPVYSFTFEPTDLALLLSACGFRLDEYNSLTGRSEGVSIEAPAILESARAQSIDADDLPVIDFIVARATK